MKKNILGIPAPQDELVLTSNSFTYHEYCLIREGLFFLEDRPRPRNLMNLIYKLDQLFLPSCPREQPPKFNPNNPPYHLSFDTSLIRSAHCYRLTFIRMKHNSKITRMQLFFLSYLIENGHTRDFLCSKATPSGLTWGGANQYLKALQKTGYTSKHGRLWTITNRGREYYASFMKEFNRNYFRTFRWR